MTTKAYLRAGVIAALACTALAGCKKTPEGQVVATVNGDEITRRDLQSEFVTMGGKNADDLAAIQPALVQNIITRKLLVQEAERTKLDQNPAYLAASQRGQEALLAQMLTQTWMGQVKEARAQDLPAFINANPLMFGERKLLAADTLSTSTASITQDQLSKLPTLDAIAQNLTARKKQFQRGQQTLDTLSMPQELARQLVAKVGGAPVAINTGGAYNIVAVRAVREAPVPQNQWTPLAKAALTQQQRMASGEDQLKRLRTAADISYLPGFAPPAQKGQPAAKK